jgi:hypothetical protein
MPTATQGEPSRHRTASPGRWGMPAARKGYDWPSRATGRTGCGLAAMAARLEGAPSRRRACPTRKKEGGGEGSGGWRLRASGRGTRHGKQGEKMAKGERWTTVSTTPPQGTTCGLPYPRALGRQRGQPKEMGARRWARRAASAEMELGRAAQLAG